MLHRYLHRYHHRRISADWKMITRNAPLVDRRLTYADMKELVALGKARGWLSVRSDPAAAPIVWAGKEPARVRKTAPEAKP